MANVLQALLEELNRKFTYEEAKAYDPAERYMTLMNNHIKMYKGRIPNWEAHFKDFTAKLRNVIGQNAKKTAQIIEAYEERGTIKKKTIINPASAKKKPPVKKEKTPPPPPKKEQTPPPPPKPKKIPAPPKAEWMQFYREELDRTFNTYEEAMAYDPQAAYEAVMTKQKEKYNPENCAGFEHRLSMMEAKLKNVVQAKAKVAQKFVKRIDNIKATQSAMNRHEALEVLKKDFPIAFSDSDVNWDERAFKRNIHLDLEDWRVEHGVTKVVIRKVLYHWAESDRYHFALRHSLKTAIRMDLYGNDVRQELPGAQEKALEMAKKLRMRSTSVEKLAEKYSYLFIYIILYSIKDEDFKALGKRPLEIATEKLANTGARTAWRMMDKIVKETGERLMVCTGDMWYHERKRLKAKRALARARAEAAAKAAAEAEANVEAAAANVEANEEATQETISAEKDSL